MKISILRELLTVMQSSATLADMSSFEDAYALIEATDRIALGLEIYWHSIYSESRQALLEYIQGRAIEATLFEWHLTRAMDYARQWQCTEALEALSEASLYSHSPLSHFMLNESREVIEAHCKAQYPLSHPDGVADI